MPLATLVLDRPAFLILSLYNFIFTRLIWFIKNSRCKFHYGRLASFLPIRACVSAFLCLLRQSVASLKWRFCLRGRFVATPQISFRWPSVAPFPGRPHYFSARVANGTAVNWPSLGHCESLSHIFRSHCVIANTSFADKIAKFCGRVCSQRSSANLFLP